MTTVAKALALTLVAAGMWMLNSTITVVLFLVYALTTLFRKLYTSTGSKDPITVCQVGFVDRCIQALFNNSIVYVSIFST